MSRQLLNPYQRNPVTITLRTLESVLRETVADLSVQDQGILYQRRTTLSQKQHEQLERLRDEALDEISKLATALGLPVEVQDTRSVLRGQLAVLWSDLHEIRPDRLAAYGAVSPDLKPVLDPPLLRLVELVKQMLDVVAQQQAAYGDTHDTTLTDR